MFQGLRTAIYQVGNLVAAKSWYREVTGVQPYFDEPFYVGFDVGGYELGLHPSEGDGGGRADAGVAYWGVADCATAFARLLELGATSEQAPMDVGEGIKVATVRDPFDNLVGIIENPHFKLPT